MEDAGYISQFSLILKQTVNGVLKSLSIFVRGKNWVFILANFVWCFLFSKTGSDLFKNPYSLLLIHKYINTDSLMSPKISKLDLVVASNM